MEELKNCPFCKHRPDLVIDLLRDHNSELVWPACHTVRIQCGYCGATQGDMPTRDITLDYCRSQVIRAWNKRAKVD